MKTVLDVGNCEPDHAALRGLIEGLFDARLERAHAWSDTEEILAQGGIDLVLVNRKLDIDYSDGIEIIRRIKADPRFAHIPVMLITNFAEHQDQAVQAGALRGFGKLDFHSTSTKERLGAALGLKLDRYSAAIT